MSGMSAHETTKWKLTVDEWEFDGVTGLRLEQKDSIIQLARFSSTMDSSSHTRWSPILFRPFPSNETVFRISLSCGHRQIHFEIVNGFADSQSVAHLVDPEVLQCYRVQIRQGVAGDPFV